MAVEPVSLVVGSSGIEATIVIAGGSNTAVALESSGELALTSGCNLYRTRLP